MKFRRNARLNTGQVSDRRGMRSAGRLGSPIAIGGGGGLIGLIVLVIVLVAGGGDLSSLGVSDPGAIPGGAAATSTALAADCQTGQDANERQDCRIVAVVNSVQEFWDQEFRDRGGTYPFAQTVLFTGATVTACGTGSAQTGPFYCPTDSQIYIDLSFFDDLRTRFGARGGPFAESYVIAHEYGHHVQDVLGILRASEGGSGVNSDSVAVELQADCLAGVWAHHA
ncbi:MAG: neutral zinc metallopeptidase, partial [Dehalococcoidia bacterium]